MQPHNVIRLDEAAPSSALKFSPVDDFFRNNELLLGINKKAYEHIEQKIEVLRYEPRQIIFDENDPGESLYLIAEGSVKISKRGRGGQQETLTFLMERDFFGEMALVDSGKRSAQASAVGHTVLGKIDRLSWDLLLHLAPHEVLSNFTRTVTRRLRHNNQHFIDEMMRNERLSLLGGTISSIMHDMNNPIACILGACEVMEGKVHNHVTDKAARMIREAIEKMETLTRELVDFSRGNTQLNLQFISLRDFMRDLEPDFAKCGPNMDVRIEMFYDGQIRIDRHRLWRVFGNLIRNAREAMKKNGGKLLRFAVRQIDSTLRFEVSDDGGGIPAELLPRIFEPFVTHGKSNGTGLGLAISKAVVEAHGGSIAVTSDGTGTCFQVDLPVEA